MLTYCIEADSETLLWALPDLQELGKAREASGHVLVAEVLIARANHRAPPDHTLIQIKEAEYRKNQCRIQNHSANPEGGNKSVKNTFKGTII
jgi:hypothetical protein